MKIKLLILFILFTFLLPLLAFVIIKSVTFIGMAYGVSIVLFLCSVVGFALNMLKRKSLRWYLIFLIASCSLLIFVGTTPLRMYTGIHSSAVIGFFLFFILLYFMLKKYEERLKAKYILISALIGCSLIQVPMRIISFQDTLISLPDYLFHLLGIVSGYLFYFSRRSFRIIILACSLLSCFFLYFKGFDIWLHRLSFNTFTGIIKEDHTEYNLMFQTNTGDTLALSDFEGKYLLLDCWYTHCGVCYDRMPGIQQLYDNYKQNPEIEIYAMHSFRKEGWRKSDPSENYTTGSEILKTRDFSFPCLSIDFDSPVLKELGVNGYPTVLIFDKQSNLIFRGSIENAKKIVKKLLKENTKDEK